jgi:uncharacterized protein with von Willebrand factor type A (vWA) domain
MARFATDGERLLQRSWLGAILPVHDGAGMVAVRPDASRTAHEEARVLYRYSRWDGTQQVDPFTADDVMERVAEDILNGADLSRSLRRMMQRGAEFTSGRRMMGLQEMLEKLREKRQQQLERFNLGSMFDDIKERLDKVIETEREGINRKINPDQGEPQDSQGQEGPQGQEGQQGQQGRPSEGQPSGGGQQSTGGQSSPTNTPPELRELLERLAKQHMEKLEQLPPDAGGRIRELRDYDFMDPEARQQFDELLEMLQKQVMQSYFQGLQQSIENMTPEVMQQIQEMVRDLNELLQKRQQGVDTETDFKEFMDKWGQFFPEGLQDIDDLMAHMQEQMARMDALMNSMTPEMRHQLEDMMQGLFKDSSMQWDLAQLAANLDRLGFPVNGQGGEYDFKGDEPLTLQEAMSVMGNMNSFDELEQELIQASRQNDVSKLDNEEISRLLGEEAGKTLEQMQEITKMLEEAGMIQKRGNDWQLTPQAIRKIGQQALQEVFGQIRESGLGDHSTERRGQGAERLDATRPYVYGDPFLVDVQRTVMNALRRGSSTPPLRLSADDFEIYETETITQCSTVIMLDMSRSMLYNGAFQEGRKVAIALDSLIRSRFPRDNLHILAFSYFVLPLKPEMLFDNYWIENGGGTNFQEALAQGRTLLNKHKGGTKQIVLITDGEPTTYSWGTDDWGNYRRSPGVIEETLREAARCARENITINTFMMEQDPGLARFVQMLSKVNNGRAFFSSQGKLGQYLLVDYLNNKQRVIR